MKFVLRAEVQELTAKATVQAAVAEKLKATVQDLGFALEQERVQKREEAGTRENERRSLLAKSLTDWILLQCVVTMR